MKGILTGLLALTLLLGAAGFSCFSAQTEDDFQQDFDTAIRRIDAMYAYFDVKALKWAEMSNLYAADIRGVTNRDQFVALLERMVDELYDPHAQLTVNLPSSPRLVPSGTDLWAEWRGSQATITQVREESDAARAGIKPNTVVLAINGRTTADAVEARMGRSYPHSTAAARDWALRAVLAGRYNSARQLRLQVGGAEKTVELPAADQFTTSANVLTSSEVKPGIGYIRFNDSLGDNTTVEAFDRALKDFRNTRNLIIDLRNTPSGGNTSVARGILGRFVSKERPYQKHVLPSEERQTGVHRSWLELVSPRCEFIYTRPVAIIVNRWTGSMGEGLAIGFDAIGSKVVGTPMAGLLGATTRVALPRTGIGINIPTERLYDVNGKPREEFRPEVLVDVNRAESGQDPYIAAALGALSSVLKRKDLGK